MSDTSAVRIAVLVPDLLGTYGDFGNAIVLEHRLRWRAIDAEIVRVDTGAVVPDSCDIYLLGGGEDAQQVLACQELASSGALDRAVKRGAVVLAVCAGFQIAGTRFPGVDGKPAPGLGLLDVETFRSDERRAVGELLARALPASLDGVDLGELTGFENHGARTRLGHDAKPLGEVAAGIGNGFDGTEGAVHDHIVGTYLHGPVLARNPALADVLLSWVAGGLAPLDVAEVDQLRAERISAVRGRRARSTRSRR